MGGIPGTRRKGKTRGGRNKNEEKEEGRNRVDSDSSSTGHKTFSFCSLPLLLPLHLQIKGLVNKNKRPDDDFPRELWTTAQHAFISGQLPRLTLKCFTPSRDQCSRECFWMSLVLVKLSIHNQPRYLGDAHCDTNLCHHPKWWPAATPSPWSSSICSLAWQTYPTEDCPAYYSSALVSSAHGTESTDTSFCFTECPRLTWCEVILYKGVQMRRDPFWLGAMEIHTNSRN